MRARASIIGQLLIVFAVCAGLIGIAAIFGYTGVTRQDATAKQLTVQDYLLQHEAGLMQVEFDVAQVAVNGYALSGRRSDLVPLRSQETGYASNVAALRATAAKASRASSPISSRPGRGCSLLPGRSPGCRPGPPRRRRWPPGCRPSRAGSTRLTTSSRSMSAASSASSPITARMRCGPASPGARRRWASPCCWYWPGSLSTVWTITRPLRALTATVRRLTAGDRSGRAAVTGSAEVREVARSVNAQADEADRLRGQQAEYNRLRTVARDAGLRIREHLAAADVLSEAQAAVQRNLQADFVYLRLVGDGRLAGRVGHDFPETVAADDAVTARPGRAPWTGCTICSGRRRAW